MTARRVLRLVLLTAAAAVLIAAAVAVDEKKKVADSTVDDIQAQLDALDPATRAAVIARLTKRGANKVHGWK